MELYKRLCNEHNIQPAETIVGKTISTDANEVSVLTAARVPFSKETLLHYIRDFVVADDQVSFKSNFNIL